MIIIGQLAELFQRHVRRAASDDVGGQIPRRDPKIQRETDERRRERGQERIGHGVSENALRILVRAQLRQRRDDRERDGRHRDELEQPREHGCDKRKQLVQLRDAEAAEKSADNQRGNPKHKLLSLPARPMLLQDGARRFIDVCIGVPMIHGKSFLPLFNYWICNTLILCGFCFSLYRKKHPKAPLFYFFSTFLLRFLSRKALIILDSFSKPCHTWDRKRRGLDYPRLLHRKKKLLLYYQIAAKINKQLQHSLVIDCARLD